MLAGAALRKTGESWEFASEAALLYFQDLRIFQKLALLIINMNLPRAKTH